MDTLEGNKIIAEFMGWELKKRETWIGKKLEYDLYEWHIPEDNVFFPTYHLWKTLNFHSSWDWLMPAVKKWNDLVISKRNGVSEGWTKWQYKTVMLRTDIKPVFKDLAEAIQWYNNNNQSK